MFDREIFVEIMVSTRKVDDFASGGYVHVCLALLLVITIFELVRMCASAQVGSLTA